MRHFRQNVFIGINLCITYILPERSEVMGSGGASKDLKCNQTAVVYFTVLHLCRFAESGGGLFLILSCSYYVMQK